MERRCSNPDCMEYIRNLDHPYYVVGRRPVIRACGDDCAVELLAGNRCVRDKSRRIIRYKGRVVRRLPVELFFK